MKKAMIGSILVIIIILIIGFFIFKYVVTEKESGKKEVKEEVKKNEVVLREVPKQHSIEFTSSGYSPKELEIKQGDSVNWVNKNNIPMWPASAIHPTHTVYPGTDIRNCGKVLEGKMFDACAEHITKKSFSFVFNEKGKWYYHDHINPRFTGQITVN